MAVALTKGLTVHAAYGVLSARVSLQQFCVIIIAFPKRILLQGKTMLFWFIALQGLCSDSLPCVQLAPGVL